MMRIFNIRHNVLALLAMAITFTACSEEDTESALTAEQQNLLGTGICFAPVVDDFATTRVAGRVSNVHNGGFNIGDKMHIYRQYWDATSNQFYYPSNDAPGAIYMYTAKMSASIVLGGNWKVSQGDTFTYTYTPLNASTPTTYTKTQGEGDSLIWENGKTVRFRAWALSTLCGENNANYPDYMVCSWVTSSGPSRYIPLNFYHVGCRFGFIPYAGNRFAGIEIATTLADYAEYGEHAQDSLDKVMEAYNKMTVPYVDDSFVLQAQGNDDSHYAAEVLTTEQIKTQCRRPAIKGSADARLYMISIPFDMSNDGNPGAPIRLPGCTHFRIRLIDVNDGDATQTQNTESKAHLMKLADVTTNGTPMFPNGISMSAGNSYMFTVGYRYGKLTIECDNNFSWAEQDAQTADANDSRTPVATGDYSWWVNAMNAAAEAVYNVGTTGVTTFAPEFTLTNITQFNEFANLVNGTGYHTDEKFELREVEGEKKWFVIATGEEATDEDKEGYIFYNRYYPQDGDNPARVEETYLRGPYAFGDESTHYQVSLTSDLDFNDRAMVTIGSSEHKFYGHFNAQGHTLTDIYLTGESLFGYTVGSIINNLLVNTTHPFRVFDTCAKTQLLGCSVLAPSSVNTLATTALGTCYFVGCIHEGQATGALVGTVSAYDAKTPGRLYMTGCMQAASGITSGALYGTGTEVSGGFFCNYYDTELSPLAHVNNAGTTYEQLDYVRGSKSSILRAKNDLLLGSADAWSFLTASQKKAYYGVAPWKAMNYAIIAFNKDKATNATKCLMHFEASTVGYDHRYPLLKYDVPAAGQYLDVTQQYN